MSRTIEEILNDEVPVVSETSGDEALAPFSPPQLKVLTFNGHERQHVKFLWLFVPLAFILVALI